MGPLFTSVTQFSKCDPFIQKWPIFTSVVHFLQAWLIFLGVNIFPGATHFAKCDPFLQVWPNFPSVTHFYKYDPIFQVWPIFTSVTQCCQVGLSRLCSATFEQLLAFGATFCGFSNLEQVLPFRAIFEQNIGLEHISRTKKSTISWKTSIHANFLKAYHVINLLNT